MKTEVELTRVSGAVFDVTNAAGARLRIEGAPELGGTGQGFRPMETQLAALASCSAIDVLFILGRMRQTVETLTVRVQGERADAVPAVFTEITLSFEASGQVEAKKLERAVELSVTKYCSVARMLAPGVRIHYQARLRP
jgi:putative redox protein